MTLFEKTWVLASGSPRRREILEEMGFQLDVVRPQVVEERQAEESVEDYVRRNARIKLEDVVARVKERLYHEAKSIFLSADTVVIHDGRLLEKPLSKEEAVSMLTSLSGKSHSVMTGFSLYYNGQYSHGEVFTQVQFRVLSPQEINIYVDTGEPMDKSGAYGAQGYGRYFIKEVHGSMLNVVGLPIAEVLEAASTFFK